MNFDDKQIRIRIDSSILDKVETQFNLTKLINTLLKEYIKNKNLKKKINNHINNSIAE